MHLLMLNSKWAAMGQVQAFKIQCQPIVPRGDNCEEFSGFLPFVPKDTRSIRPFTQMVIQTMNRTNSYIF